jgi:pimeloyl-ACP methyl ester carboxylesterase
MPVSVIFPKVSLETDVGVIARWLKQPGESVNQGDVLFEIDSDKAAVEVEATASGTVAQVARAGTEVRVGDIVGHILSTGEQPPDDRTATPDQHATSTANAAADTGKHMARSTRIVATPLARRMAAQSRIDLSTIQGSGPRGRIQKSDVLDIAGTAKPAPAGAIAGERLNAVWLQKDGSKTIVALHGFASDHNAWRGLLVAGRPQARLLALDLPGHGQSTRTVPPDLDAICEMVEQSLRLEGVEAATLVGHSFGAAVAARLATRGFIAIRSLLLMAPAGLGPEIRPEFIRGFVAASRAASLLPWLRELVLNPAVISQAFLRSVEEQRKDTGLTHALETFADRYFCEGTQTFSIRSDLERLRMPARIIFGTHDRIIPFAHTRSLPGRIALHAFDCGHLPHLEEPEMTLSVVQELLTLAGAGSEAASNGSTHGN